MMELKEIARWIITALTESLRESIKKLLVVVFLAIAAFLLWKFWEVAIMLLTHEVAVIWLLAVVILSSMVIGIIHHRKTKQYDALVKECITEEEVSKEHFDEFKAITLSFEDLFNTNKNPLVKLFNELYAKTPELLSYNNRLKDYISRSYNNCIKRLKKFDGTKECFELLVNEFENVFFAYEDLFVKPIEKRKDEIARDKNLKRKFNEFADEYGAMRRQYIDYGKEMNKMYGTNIIRTDFDYVDKI